MTHSTKVMMLVLSSLLLLGAVWATMPAGGAASTSPPEPAAQHVDEPAHDIDATIPDPLVACTDPGTLALLWLHVDAMAAPGTALQVQAVLPNLDSAAACDLVNKMLAAIWCADDDDCSLSLDWLLEFVQTLVANINLQAQDVAQATMIADESVRLPPVEDETKPHVTQAEATHDEAKQEVTTQGAQAYAGIFGPPSQDDSPALTTVFFAVAAEAASDALGVSQMAVGVPDLSRLQPSVLSVNGGTPSGDCAPLVAPGGPLQGIGA